MRNHGGAAAKTEKARADALEVRVTQPGRGSAKENSNNLTANNKPTFFQLHFIFNFNLNANSNRRSSLYQLQHTWRNAVNT